MANLNKCLFIGRLIKDPETAYSQSGVAVCKFTIATNEKYRDEEKTEFTNCVAFGKTGETIQKYCTKGKELYLDCRKETTKYQDQNGQDKWSTSFIVNNFQFLGSQQQSSNNQQAPQQGFAPQQQGYPNQGQPSQQNFGHGSQQNQGFAQQQGDDIPF